MMIEKEVIATLLLAFTNMELSQSIGGVDGGGGAGVRCGTDIELLDIHEGKRDGLQYSANPQNLDEASTFLAEKFGRHFWNPITIDMPRYVTHLKEMSKVLLSGKPIPHPEKENKYLSFIEYVEKLELSKDIGDYDIDPSCQLEQIAYFSDTEKKIRIHKKRWNELDWLNRAALIVHELTYAEYRDAGLEKALKKNNVITSIDSRQFTSKLLSDQGLTPRMNEPDVFYMNCGGVEDNNSYFFAHEEIPDEVTLHFNLIHGLSSDYQLKAIVPDLSIFDLVNDFEINKSVPITLTDRPNDPGLKLDIHKTWGGGLYMQAYVDTTSGRLDLAPPELIDCPW